MWTIICVGDADHIHASFRSTCGYESSKSACVCQRRLGCCTAQVHRRQQVLKALGAERHGSADSGTLPLPRRGASAVNPAAAAAARSSVFPTQDRVSVKPTASGAATGSAGPSGHFSSPAPAGGGAGSQDQWDSRDDEQLLQKLLVGGPRAMAARVAATPAARRSALQPRLAGSSTLQPRLALRHLEPPLHPSPVMGTPQNLLLHIPQVRCEAGCALLFRFSSLSPLFLFSVATVGDLPAPQSSDDRFALGMPPRPLSRGHTGSCCPRCAAKLESPFGIHVTSPLEQSVTFWTHQVSAWAEDHTPYAIFDSAST